MDDIGEKWKILFVPNLKERNYRAMRNRQIKDWLFRFCRAPPLWIIVVLV